jgi:hypothetical protein
MTGQLFPPRAIAKLLNITDRQLRQLAQEGVVPRAARGRYPLVGCVQGFIAYLQRKNMIDPNTNPDELPPFQRKAYYQAELLKREVEERRAELLPVEDMKIAFRELMPIVHVELEQVADCAEQLAGMDDQAVIRALVLQRTRRALTATARRIEEWVSERCTKA